MIENINSSLLCTDNVQIKINYDNLYYLISTYQ